MAYDHLRLGKEHFLYNNWRVPGSENTFRLRGGKAGLELNGIVSSRFYYSAGIVNPDGGMDGYGTFRFKLGGTPYDRSAPTEEAADQAIGVLPTGFWVDNSFELAAFGYFGKTDVAGDVSDSFSRLGAGARWTYQNLDLSAAYVFGKNNDPLGDGTEIKSKAWHVEASYYIYPWMIAQAKYEALKLDSASTLVDQKQTVFGLIFMLRANIKVVTEAILYNKASLQTNMLQLRLVYGF
jgi:predicted porin